MHKRVTHILTVATKGLSSAFIVAGGDAFCQLIIEEGSFDALRCFRMFLIGGVLVAPALHFWSIKANANTYTLHVLPFNAITLFLLHCFDGMRIICRMFACIIPFRILHEHQVWHPEPNDTRICAETRADPPRLRSRNFRPHLHTLFYGHIVHPRGSTGPAWRFSARQLQGKSVDQLGIVDTLQFFELPLRPGSVPGALRQFCGADMEYVFVLEQSSHSHCGCTDRISYINVYEFSQPVVVPLYSNIDALLVNFALQKIIFH